MRRLLTAVLGWLALGAAPAAGQGDTLRIHYECPSCEGQA